mmetsp:Transcript_3616/g.9877  ORF Transcript_3616/g.9877 Transcript_3616/m.9877 type:complete len:243 (-) Transcript_3616:202-930(-)
MPAAIERHTLPDKVARRSLTGVPSAICDLYPPATAGRLVPPRDGDRLVRLGLRDFRLLAGYRWEALQDPHVQSQLVAFPAARAAGLRVEVPEASAVRVGGPGDGLRRAVHQKQLARAPSRRAIRWRPCDHGEGVIEDAACHESTGVKHAGVSCQDPGFATREIGLCVLGGTGVPQLAIIAALHIAAVVLVEAVELVVEPDGGLHVPCNLEGKGAHTTDGVSDVSIVENVLCDAARSEQERYP